MKITELHVEGFRSLKDVTWKPGDLNIVIGANASGKSNLLMLLEMMSASAKGQLFQWLNLQGGISEIRFFDKKDQIVIKFEIFHTTERTITFYTLSRYGLIFSNYGNNYTIEKEELRKFDPVTKEPHGIKASSPLTTALEPWFSKEKSHEKETYLSQFNKPSLGSIEKQNYYNYFYYWKSYREFRTDHNATVRLPVVTGFEEELNVDSENFVNVLYTHYSRDLQFKENINDGMRAAFGKEFIEISILPASSSKVELAIRWAHLKHPVSAINLSDGTLRFLHLLTVLSLPELPSLIAIDEPETGLHPSMLPIIAEYAAAAAERTQVIFTTHSTDFLNAFHAIEPQPTITVCQLEDGETKLKVLDGERLKKWVKEYALGELYQTGELEDME